MIVNNVTYMNEIYHIGRKELIKICGMNMSLDTGIEYKKNITERIDKLTLNLKNWSKRCLSMNGRMIIAKTYGLSQLTYAFQFYRVEIKDLKQIEKIIYSYVNTNKVQVMPERIRRSYLKNPKNKGGINGIDIEAFHYCVTFKQYEKSIRNSNTIRNLHDVIHKYDYIANICQIRSNNLWRKQARPPNNIAELQLLSGIHVREFLKPKNKAIQLANELQLTTSKEIQDAINNQGICRRNKNMLLKSMPSIFRNAISNNLLMDSFRAVCIPTSEKYMNIGVEKSAIIQLSLKEVLKKIEPIRLCNIYKNRTWEIKDDTWLGAVWKIKHPTLRHYRFKVIMKDIFSKERMKRFGMINSDLCEICGMSETVEHQLYECTNAARFREYASRISPSFIMNDLYSMIEVGRDRDSEILKSVIFKFLIQIDRSKNATFDVFNQYYISQLRIMNS